MKTYVCLSDSKIMSEAKKLCFLCASMCLCGSKKKLSAANTLHFLCALVLKTERSELYVPLCASMCLCGSKKKLSAAKKLCFLCALVLKTERSELYVLLCAYVVQKKTERSEHYTFYVPSQRNIPMLLLRIIHHFILQRRKGLNQDLTRFRRHDDVIHVSACRSAIWIGE